MNEDPCNSPPRVFWVIFGVRTKNACYCCMYNWSKSICGGAVRRTCIMYIVHMPTLSKFMYKHIKNNIQHTLTHTHIRISISLRIRQSHISRSWRLTSSLAAVFVLLCMHTHTHTQVFVYIHLRLGIYYVKRQMKLQKRGLFWQLSLRFSHHFYGLKSLWLLIIPFIRLRRLPTNICLDMILLFFSACARACVYVFAIVEYYCEVVQQCMT